MKKLFLLSFFLLLSNVTFLAFTQTQAISDISQTDNKDWILKSGYYQSSPSQIILDGSDTYGGSVKIFSEAGLNGPGNIELQSWGKIILRYGTTENSNVRVGIGTNNPAEVLHINGYIRGNIAGGALRIRTANNGYLELGPQNAAYANIFTDRSYFLFNQPISSTNDFTIKTNGTTRMTILNSTGNVGIGTIFPNSSLDVNGVIHNGGADFILGKYDFRAQGTNLLNRAITHAGMDYSKDELIFNYDGDFEDGIVVMGPRTLFLGTVGLGLDAPVGCKLAVDGKIMAEEIEVKMSEGWPDYVFEKTYKFMSLEELDSYIKKNKHLPNIPTSEEVMINGINIGEMNKKVIEKIEEITLYLIELQKQNELLIKRIEILENK